MRIVAALLVGATFAVPALAQPAEPSAPEQVAPVPAVIFAAPATPAEAVLPPGSDILLRVNDQLTTRTHRMGDNFSLTVVSDVSVDGHVVIPAGTRGVGQVTWRSGRGGFGKSGKMEVTLRYVELGGRRIPIEGFHRQEGEGRTAATVGAIAGAGVIGGLFVRGSNARIPAGFELTGRTSEAVPVTAPAEPGGAAAIAASYTPGPVATEIGRRRDQRPPRQTRAARSASR